MHLGNTGVSSTMPARRFAGGEPSHSSEVVAEETPVTMVFNGSPQAVMMATPDDLHDFASGFAITEGFVKAHAELTRIDIVHYSRGVEIQMETISPIGNDTPRRRLAGRTGCGICGKDEVDQVLRAIPAVDSTSTFSTDAIARAMRELREQQPLNRATGGTHAAGWASLDGQVMLVREDVGRHNALDKLIGALHCSATEPNSGFVVLTSRGSFELVQKVAVFGAALLCTVSAPTALAIRVASDANVTLAGFARDERVTAYSHTMRITR